MPLWIPEQMSAFAFHAISLERRGWALCSRHPNFGNGCFNNRNLALERRGWAAFGRENLKASFRAGDLRQSFWDREQLEIRETLAFARQFVHMKRLPTSPQATRPRQ